MRICIGRGSLIGDTISVFPAIDWARQKYPNSFISTVLAKKCKQLAPLIRNHSQINQLLITQEDESLNEHDWNFVKSHDLWIDPFPRHKNDLWYHEVDNNFYRENAGNMTGLPYDEFPNKYPTLERYWAANRTKKTISIQSTAGYGMGRNRAPSAQWWNELLPKVHELGYETYQVGSPNDFKINTNYSYCHASFENLVKNILDCEIFIGSDSGLGILVAAYREIKQINLLTDWLGNSSNPLALAPRGDNSLITDLFAHGGCDNISQESVLSILKSL